MPTHEEAVATRLWCQRHDPELHLGDFTDDEKLRAARIDHVAETATSGKPHRLYRSVELDANGNEIRLNPDGTRREVSTDG